MHSFLPWMQHFHGLNAFLCLCEALLVPSLGHCTTWPSDLFFFFFWWYILLFLKCGQYQISVWTHHSLSRDWMPKRDNAISHTARCHTESTTEAIEGIASSFSFIWKQIITRVRKIDPFNYEFCGIIAAISLGRDMKWLQRPTRRLKPEFLVKEQTGRLKRAGCSLAISKYFRDECSPLYSPLVNARNWWTLDLQLWAVQVLYSWVKTAEEWVHYYHSNQAETGKTHVEGQNTVKQET